MNKTSSNQHSRYRCCLCRYFKLEGYRWGYCQLLNVYVKGTIEACQMSVPPFESTDNKESEFDSTK